MKTCGIKVTHDGGIAVIENQRLLFASEVEKFENRPRYSKLGSVAMVDEILASEGLSRADIDEFAVDGWKGGSAEGWPTGGYHEGDSTNHLRSSTNDGIAYETFSHNEGHIYGSYCASPFARNWSARNKTYVLVWDGGQGPRLYSMGAEGHKFLGSLFDLSGLMYGIMRYYFGPYRDEEVVREMATALATDVLPVHYGGYEAPGKLMSYIALGEPDRALVRTMARAYDSLGGKRGLRESRSDYVQDGRIEHAFCQLIAKRAGLPGDASVLASIHTFLQELLLKELAAACDRDSNLIFTGGSALNIKWNSAIRSDGHFRDVWVPPFPNDSGSAIGAACRAVWEREGPFALDWSVYAGPNLLPSAPIDGWVAEKCSTAALAQFLASKGEPVVFLSGRAEIGPRALGNRSILAPATDGGMKGRLNAMKKREDFRPVAPICLEARAPEIFSPGSRDPFMLFDHAVRGNWVDRIPAIVHLDGTARLQTLSEQSGSRTYEVLSYYAEITGIPVLCNTSANRNGSGFFPDAKSAMEWGECDHVWADGVLFSRG